MNRTRKKNERTSNKHGRARKQCCSYMIKHETGSEREGIRVDCLCPYLVSQKDLLFGGGGGRDIRNKSERRRKKSVFLKKKRT